MMPLIQASVFFSFSNFSSVLFWTTDHQLLRSLGKRNREPSGQRKKLLVVLRMTMVRGRHKGISYFSNLLRGVGKLALSQLIEKCCAEHLVIHSISALERFLARRVVSLQVPEVGGYKELELVRGFFKSSEAGWGEKYYKVVTGIQPGEVSLSCCPLS